MSAGLKGDIGKLRALERSIRDLPRTVGMEVAGASATIITGLARTTYESGQNAYGDEWVPGVDGNRVHLRKSGALAAGVSYVAIGTRLRSKLGPRYAKYQVGTRPVLPTGRLPLAYANALRAKANEIITAKLGGA